MRKLAVSILALILMLGISVQAAEWSIDQVHSAIEFSVRHLAISKVKGKFKDFEGKLDFDGKAVENGSAEMTIQVASVDTENEKRDNHLRSSDFFAAEENPTITFKSKKVTAVTDGNFQIIGDMTLRGVTKEVTFDCELHGVVQGPYGYTRAGFSAETTINRQDFGVSWSKTLDAGGLVVGNDVKLSLELEFVEAKAEEG
jgi:polyisoprenoid-binding protein YceI